MKRSAVHGHDRQTELQETCQAADGVRLHGFWPQSPDRGRRPVTAVTGNAPAATFLTSPARAERAQSAHGCATMRGLEALAESRQGRVLPIDVPQPRPHTATPRHQGRAYAQPQERRPDAARRRAGRHHRGERVGQVVARLRHHLRRRASAATSSRCRPTPASSSSGWRSPTSIASRASPRRSPSARRTASATRAPRSARSPRSTTTCGCCSPASAAPSAGSAASRSSAKRPRWCPTACWRCRRARGCSSASTCRCWRRRAGGRRPRRRGRRTSRATTTAGDRCRSRRR